MADASERSSTLLPTEPNGVEMMAKFFRALGDPARLRLLEFLLHEEHAVGECVTHIGAGQPGELLLVPFPEGLQDHAIGGFRAVQKASHIKARIGRENAEALHEAAVVTSPYSMGADQSARLGVLGPTRMDYSNNMAAVRAVARYVSRLLGEDER